MNFLIGQDLISDDEALALLYLFDKKKQRHPRRWYIRPINVQRPISSHHSTLIAELGQLDPERFYNYFRMTSEIFHELLDRIRVDISHSYTHKVPISAEERLAITLRLLASGDQQRSLAFDYRTGFATVYAIFYETCKAIWKHLNEKFVKAPQTTEEWQNIAHGFWRKWQFPLCLGAVDGKHVQIIAPRNSGSLYYNYKGTFSIVLMAIVDSRYRFLIVDVGGFGSQNDGKTFKESIFGSMLYNNLAPIPVSANLPGTHFNFPHVFVADAAFQLHQHIMKPFPGQFLENRLRIFNYRLSRARRCVENAFGILAARWRIFKGPLYMKPENAEHVIKAAIALHNFLMSKNDNQPMNTKYAPSTFIDYENSDGSHQDGEWRIVTKSDTCFVLKRQKFGSNHASASAREMREKLADYFLTEEGSVSWQNNI